MIVTIYDNKSRPDTTGVYVGEALKSLNQEVEHCVPGVDGVPLGQDQYILVDDGFDYSLDERITPLTYWAIDTHLTPGQCVTKARNASKVYAAQKAGARYLAEVLEREVEWLPLAHSPKIHNLNRTIPGNTIHDVVFVGNVSMSPIFTERRELLDKMFKAVPNFLFIRNVDRRMVVESYVNSQIILNKSVKGDLNMRVFEGMASGRMLLTDRVEGLEDLFVDGQDLVLYDSADDAIDKAQYFLSHPELCNTIGLNGAKAVTKHSYENRVKTMLEA